MTECEFDMGGVETVDRRDEPWHRGVELVCRLG